ncbi:MAG: antitoxin ParD1/3/4 [Bacteroidia bacterium]|jgi:antitoxin ParD1/3/4
MNVSLTQKQEKYISEQLESGDYQNASELVRDALRLHQVYRNKVINDLRLEIEKGCDSPVSKTRVQDFIARKTKAKKK